MRKLLVVAIVLLSMIIILSSCSYDLCPTYSNSSIKSYGPKYTYAHTNASKKVKKNKVW
ncbi:MAG TPA: hypothetical protein VL443_11055 [Cyclobacteriaceae bacterium]|nr:hypothetical protein [Cyclobacteriaceae bacterium]